jgi:hypothetical protein
VLVGGEVFDRLEAAGCSSGKAVEKPDFLKNEAEIGGERSSGRLL